MFLHRPFNDAGGSGNFLTPLEVTSVLPFVAVEGPRVHGGGQGEIKRKQTAMSIPAVAVWLSPR